MKHKVLVYGTLRPGSGSSVVVSGTMYDLGSYPGIRLSDPGTFRAEVIEVDDEGLQRLDRYEGYYPEEPDVSLYLRKQLIRFNGEGGAFWIYEYNQDLKGHRQTVPEGDWLSYLGATSGSAAALAEGY